MGEPALRVIAHELVQAIKANVTVDWMHRQSARANIRRHVKRLLRKYGYPPDLQDAAVQNVLQQAEALSAEWARVGTWRRCSVLPFPPHRIEFRSEACIRCLGPEADR